MEAYKALIETISSLISIAKTNLKTQKKKVKSLHSIVDSYGTV